MMKIRYVDKILPYLFLSVVIYWVFNAIWEKNITKLYFLAAIVFVTAISWVGHEIYLVIIKRKANYPKKGQATMDDVKRLALSGHKSLAVGAYREIKDHSFKKAKQEVDKIIAESKEQDK